MDHRLEVILSARDATKNAFQSATGRIKAMTKNVFSLRGAFATLAGTGGIGLFVKKSLDMADTIAKTADKLGLTTDALQEYRYAANLAGVEQKTLDMAMQRFTRRTAEAAQGKGELKGILEQYGIAVRDAAGNTRNHEDALNDLADVMAGTEDESERLRIAFKAFDSEGVAMVNMLKNGSAAMKKTRQDARDLGIVMDAQLIRNSEKAKDELTKLTQVLKVQFMSAAVGLAPEIARIAENTTDWWQANQELVKTDVARYANEIKYAIEGIKKVYDQLPEGVVGPAGFGLVGTALFGPVAGVTIGLITAAAQETKKLKDELFKIYDDIKGKLEGHFFRGHGVTGSWGAPESGPPPPKPPPPPVIDTTAYDALMKEVAKAQTEFQESLVVPSGTAETMEQQLRVDIGRHGFDRTKEDIENTKRAFESMYSDLKFQSDGYYEYRKSLLKKQAGEYEKYTGDTVLAHQWLTEQIKSLDQERLGASKDTFSYMTDMSERTAEAMEDNFSSFFKDVFRGELDGADEYFRAFCYSLTDSFSDAMGQMAKEALFGGGSSGGSGLFGSIASGIAGAFGGGGGTQLWDGYSAITWHKGGVVGEDAGGPARYLPASMFAHAPRLHKGLAPDEFPAILQRGEMVIPANRATQPTGTSGGDTYNNITIQAIDSKSFAELVNRDALVVLEGVNRALERNTGQRHKMKRMVK